MTKRLAELAEERRKLLDQKADRLLKSLPETPEQTRRLEETENEIELGVFERALRAYEAQPWAKEVGTARATDRKSTSLNSSHRP